MHNRTSPQQRADTSTRLYDGSADLAAHFSDQENIVDLLKTAPSSKTFEERVARLKLSSTLEAKVLGAGCAKKQDATTAYLSKYEEKELATEVLLRRHAFTRQIFAHRFFRQAALSVIQNIYLFKQRRIFFGTTDNFGEAERQAALLLFSQSPHQTSIPLGRTFQHLMLARIWNRIVTTADTELFDSAAFNDLQEVIEELNTLRNIYMLLCAGLVRKLSSSINDIYRQSITHDDACQIGNFGVARAAYRYHPSTGLRFSSYAAYWILKEIQRQSLQGRLIRISSSLVEQLSRQARTGSAQSSSRDSCDAYELLCRATPYMDQEANDFNGKRTPGTAGTAPERIVEKQQLLQMIMKVLGSRLSTKSGDVLMRRYGLGPYQGREQSIVEIAAVYGVSRGSIYQLEKRALHKLRNAMSDQHSPGCSV
ncbi:MAG: sigma-70 family RNA polymerase sigma factor [Desulfopila sp.]